MSRLTLRLPETLHQQLINLAQEEGISLNQYIVYALTRQISTAYQVTSISPEKIEEQQRNFDRLINQLGQANSKEIATILSEREISAPEPELTPEAIAIIRDKIAKKNICNEQ
jgi:hypothetical protein